MSDWECKVVQIESVIKHPNADNLDIVLTSMGDYPVICRSNEWKAGDLASYIAIDTVVPDNELFYFLCPKHEGSTHPKYEMGTVPERYRRIKARRLRGIYSQGILINAPKDFALNDSVVEYFGFTKYLEEEEEESDPIRKNKEKSQNEKKPEGWDLPYYDILAARKYYNIFLPDEEVVITEKIHGANCAVIHDGERLWVKSRNFFKRDKLEVPIYKNIVNEETGKFISREKIGTDIVESSDQWWKVSRRLSLTDKLSKFPYLAFFGEVYGQVGGFPYDTKIVDGERQSNIRFFDIWDIKRMKFLNYPEFYEICSSLNLDMAPVLYAGTLPEKDKVYALAEGKSTLNEKHVREGVVIRLLKERFADKIGRVHLKIVGEGYNLQKK